MCASKLGWVGLLLTAWWGRKPRATKRAGQQTAADCVTHAMLASPKATLLLLHGPLYKGRLCSFPVDEMQVMASLLLNRVGFCRVFPYCCNCVLPPE